MFRRLPIKILSYIIQTYIPSLFVHCLRAYSIIGEYTSNFQYCTVNKNCICQDYMLYHNST